MLRTGRFDIRLLFLLALCWIPAGLLVLSVFKTRRPPFVPPRRRLAREEAPALFAIVHDLAARAGTSPPAEVYLEPLPTLAVTEAGSLFRSRRVMIIGAPLLHLLTVDDLRVGIAHELGHFVGGDTRLTTFAVQTHALFASVVRTMERDPFRVGTQHHAIEGGLAFAQMLGRVLVNGYGRLYLRLTRSMSRRQELAADALSAAIVGNDAARRALEKISVGAPLYGRYLQSDVGFAVTRGAMPMDLSPGFARLRERLLATDAGRSFVAAVRMRATDPYDTHPALADRLRALEPRAGASETRPDERPAVALFADPAALDAWLHEATRERVIAAAAADGRSVGAVRSLPWSSIPGEVYAPAAREAARRAAERLHPLFPEATSLGAMFAAVWRELDRGSMAQVALRLDPGLGQMPRDDGERAATRLCGELLATLMQGALLERGAVMQDSLGEEDLVLRAGEERVAPGELLRLLATDGKAGRAAFESWAARLEGAA
jgi:Zn-dependent protease with chaperone function